MKHKYLRSVAQLALLFSMFLLFSANGFSQDLAGIKCVVNGDKNATVEAVTDYRDAKVYLCCGGCKTKFTDDVATYATRANHQLVLTMQFQQTACPISGGDLDPEVTANVGGTKVAFCCQKCLKQVTDEPDMAKRAEMIFGDKAFEKSFALPPVEEPATP